MIEKSGGMKSYKAADDELQTGRYEQTGVGKKNPEFLT